MEIIQDDIVTVDLKTATVRAILVHDPMKSPAATVLPAPAAADFHRKQSKV